LRRACELALAAVIAAAGCAGGSEGPCPPSGACAGTRPPGVTASADIPFRDAGATARSSHEDESPAILSVAEGSATRITAYQGAQRTGGYAIRIERITRAADELHVTALFSEPPPGSFTTMALTSPAHTVTVDDSAPVAVLFDQTGAERARTRRR
jgi:hypothetical protein